MVMSNMINRKRNIPRIEFITQTVIDENAENYKEPEESNYDRRNKLIQ